MKVLVSQIGAREHYAVPQVLHRQGLLAALVTDWYAFGKQKAEKLKLGTLKRDGEVLRPLTSGISRSIFRFLSSVIRNPSARAARCEAIPDDLVLAFRLRSLLWKWRVRRMTAIGRSHEAFIETNAAFASAVARCHLSAHDVFFGYSYGSLETLVAEKRRGVLTVLGQIDPGAVEFRLVAEEMARFPELAGAPKEFPTPYYERNRQEWELADIIIVNSEWSREALVQQGVNPAKIEILPLAYETDDGNRKSEIGNRKSEQVLRVLWLGQVNVRKGIHYLMAAARLLEREKVQFDVVGPIGISEAAIKLAPHNVRFHGPVSRDRVAEWYRRSDVFVLPTLSDGFALTQLEALAHGLPVIATPNCGRVVAEGKTGFIIPARDSQALVDAMLKFTRHANLAKEMGPACRAAVKSFSLENYGRRLVEIIHKKAETSKS